MRRVLITAGALVMGYAVAGAVLDSEVDRVGVVIFLAAVLILHDGVLLPLVLAAGAVTGRPAAVRAAGLITLSVLVVGAPLVVSGGASYGWRLLLVVAGIWLVVLLAGFRKHFERWWAGRGRAHGG